MLINDDMHGTVTPDQIPIILDRYLKKAKQETASKSAS